MLPLKGYFKWLAVFTGLILVIILGRELWQLWEVHTLRSIVASQADCVAPCWRGLQPGISTEKNIVDWLESTGKKDFDHIAILKDSYNNRIALRSGNSEELIRLWKNDANLTAIEFMDTFPTITLGTVLSEMGPPDTFGAKWLMDMHATYVGRLILIYEDQGVVFQSSFIGKLPAGSDPDACLVNIKPDIALPYIYLTNAKASHQLLQNAKKSLKHAMYITIQDWNGVGLRKIDPCESLK